MKRTLSPEDKARHNAILKNRKAFEFESNSAENSAENNTDKTAETRARRYCRALLPFPKFFYGGVCLMREPTRPRPDPPI